MHSFANFINDGKGRTLSAICDKMRPKEYTSVDMFCIQLPSLRAGQIWGCFALYCCLCSCESLYVLPSFLKQALPKSIITAVLSDITTLSSFISLCKIFFSCMYFKPLITPINIDFQLHCVHVKPVLFSENKAE